MWRQLMNWLGDNVTSFLPVGHEYVISACIDGGSRELW